MFKGNSIWSIFISFGLLLGINQVTTAENLQTESGTQINFRRIEQPLPLKIGVTLGGMALIGLEIWWFLASKTKAHSAKIQQGIQELDIIVDGGYIPNRIVVQLGKPVRLNFWRKDPSSCLEQVVFPDFHQAVDLTLNQKISIEFTPQKVGIYPFHCGMNMFRGVVEVSSPENSNKAQFSEP